MGYTLEKLKLIQSDEVSDRPLSAYLIPTFSVIIPDVSCEARGPEHHSFKVIPKPSLKRYCIIPHKMGDKRFKYLIVCQSKLTE